MVTVLLLALLLLKMALIKPMELNSKMTTDNSLATKPTSLH